jgi:hypothetical protein
MTASNDQTEDPLPVRVKAALASSPADADVDSDVEQALRVLAAAAPAGRRWPLILAAVTVVAVLSLALVVAHSLS